MNNTTHTSNRLIAPCGMNCGVCIAFLRDKNKCPGCNSVRDNDKPHNCKRCIIKNCDELQNNTSDFCYDCEKFPCKRLKSLDARYTKNYKTSLIENLKCIESIGLEEFSKSETEKWSCNYCDGTISIHRGLCLKCGKSVN